MISGLISFSQPNQISYSMGSGVILQSFSLSSIGIEYTRPETREEKLGRLHDLRLACQQLERELETKEDDGFELSGTL